MTDVTHWHWCSYHGRAAAGCGNTRQRFLPLALHLGIYCPDGDGRYGNHCVLEGEFRSRAKAEAWAKKRSMAEAWLAKRNRHL